jgi:hypothetical protein
MIKKTDAVLKTASVSVSAPKVFMQLHSGAITVRFGYNHTVIPGANLQQRRE